MCLSTLRFNRPNNINFNKNLSTTIHSVNVCVPSVSLSDQNFYVEIGYLSLRSVSVTVYFFLCRSSNLFFIHQTFLLGFMSKGDLQAYRKPNNYCWVLEMLKTRKVYQYNNYGSVAMKNDYEQRCIIASETF